jgi:hypothetical protein
MKRVIAIVGAYSLLWIGERLSFIQSWGWTSYKIWNKIMCWSSDIQEWGCDDFGPWVPINHCPSCGKEKDKPKMSCYNEFHK